MKTLLIVCHSVTGGTRQMAEAAAMEPGVDVRLLQAAAAGPGDMLAADGYIFAAPEKLAALAGLMKDFFDRCYYPVPISRDYSPSWCLMEEASLRPRAKFFQIDDMPGASLSSPPRTRALIFSGG